MSSNRYKCLLKEIREDIKNKNYKEVIKKCEEILQDEPKNYMALVFMGAAYQEKDKKEAAKYLRKAITCGHDEPTVALQGLLNCAENDELIDILRKLLKLLPQKYPEYHQKLVSISNKYLKDCIEILKNETILENENNKINCDHINSAFKSIGKILLKQTDIPKEWEEMFERALQIIISDENFEDHFEYSKRYLKLLYKLKKNEELLKEASKLHEKYPNKVYPLEWICKIYIENYQNTIQISFELNLNESIDYYFNTLIKLNETSTLGLFVKAIQLYENKEYVNSRNILLQIKLLSNDNNFNNMILKLLTDIYIKIGAYSLAASNLKRLQIEDIRLGLCLSYSENVTDLNDGINILKKINTDNINDKDDFDRYSSLIRSYVNINEIEKAREILSETNNLTDEQKLLLNAEYFMEPKLAIDELEKCTTSDEFLKNFLKAKKYFEIQEYEKSLRSILIAAKIRPYYSDCFMLFGEIYLSTKNFEYSRKCFEKCVNLNPQNRIAVVKLSGIYRKFKEWNLNSNLLKNTVESFEDNKCSWALFQLGLHYLNINQYDKAIHALQLVVRLDSNNIIYMEALADAYQQRGSYNSAMNANEKILEMDSNNIMAKLQAAQLKTVLHMFNEAIELFEDILDVKTDFIPAIKGIADAHCGLAKSAMSMRLSGRCKDHLQKAIDYLQRAFVANKKDVVWLWRIIANIFVNVGCLPESKANLNVLGKLAGQEEDIIKIQGKELFEFAKKFYAVALKMRKNDHLLWHELALCYYNHALRHGDNEIKLKNLKSSVEACKQAICYKPYRWENWNLLGVIFARKEMNNLPLSQHCFIKALEIDKRSYVTWSNLGTLYLSLGNIKLANQAFKKAQQSNPSYLNAWIGQAIIAEQIGENIEAMDLFRHCTQLGFNLESAISYGYWVCSTLSDPEKMKNPDYKYAIVQMHAISTALDSMTWYFYAEELNSSVEALSYFGYLMFKQSLWRPAIKIFELAIERAKDQGQKDIMSCNLAYTYLKNNQPQEAIKTFTLITEASLVATVGLALANLQAGNIEDSYSIYSTALEWLANTEAQKSFILLQILTILYKIKGKDEVEPVLYKLLQLSDKPVESLYFASALAIIHKDWEFVEAVLDELSAYENNPEHCHHIAFLNACYYSAINSPKKGLIHISQRLHVFPDQPLLRKVLAEYLLNHSSKTKTRLHLAASQIAQSIITLGLMRSTSSIEAAKALVVASVTAGVIDKHKQRILAQSAIHIHPTYEEAWISLKSLKIDSE